MRLPGITYTMGPAMVSSRSTWAKGLQALSASVNELAIEDANAEVHKLWAEARNQLNEGKQFLTKEQYAEDDEGNLRSRHHDLMSEYEMMQKGIHKRIIDRAENSIAKKLLEEKFLEQDVRDRELMGGYVADWTKTESRRGLDESIESNLAEGRFKDAEKALASGIKTGAYSVREANKIGENIQGARQYHQANGLVQTSKTADDFQSTVKFLSDPKNLRHMSAQQRNAVIGAHNQKVEDTLIGSVRYVAETRGIKAAESYVRGLNRTGFDAMGFSTEDDKYSAISRSQQVVEDYRFGLKEKKDAVELNKSIQKFEFGAPTDRKSKTDKKAANAYFDERIGEAQIGSPEYTQEAARMAKVHGWVPPRVESDLRANLDHIDPASVTAAASTIMSIEQAAPRSLENMNENDLAFAFTITQYSQYGQLPEETIAKYREGIYRVPNSLRDQRGKYFDQKMKRGAQDDLTALIDSDDSANPWFGSAADFPTDMMLEFELVYRDEYLRTGDKNVAGKMAYQLMKGKWSPVADDDMVLPDRKFKAYSPQAVLGRGQEDDRISEQIKYDFEKAGLDQDTHELVIIPGKKEWLILDENKDVIIGEDGMALTWNYDRNNDQQAKRDRKAAEKAAKQREIQAERQRSEESIEFNRTWEEGLISKGMGAVVRGYHQDVEWMADAFEFVLKDIPDGTDKLWNKLPHNREWAKKARGEYDANKQ